MYLCNTVNSECLFMKCNPCREAIKIWLVQRPITSAKCPSWLWQLWQLWRAARAAKAAGATELHASSGKRGTSGLRADPWLSELIPSSLLLLWLDALTFCSHSLHHQKYLFL